MLINLNLYGDFHMKPKLIAAILALTLVSWAQSTTPAPAPEQQKSAPEDAKAGCPCCADKADTADHADMHKGMACMRHAAAGKDDKETMSCCGEKDGKHSCCGKDMKACAKDEKAACCGEKCEDSCRSAKDGKSAHNCCDEKQCGKHQHHDSPAPGN